MTKPNIETSTASGNAPKVTVEEGIKASLKARLAEGQARHNERLARNAGAIFARSLDGYIISEEDLIKLIENQKA